MEKTAVTAPRPPMIIHSHFIGPIDGKLWYRASYLECADEIMEYDYCELASKRGVKKIVKAYNSEHGLFINDSSDVTGEDRKAAKRAGSEVSPAKKENRKEHKHRRHSVTAELPIQKKKALGIWPRSDDISVDTEVDTGTGKGKKAARKEQQQPVVSNDDDDEKEESDDVIENPDDDEVETAANDSDENEDGNEGDDTITASTTGEKKTYEVDTIIGHSFKRGRTYYDVTWVGYPGEVSPMTEAALKGAPEILAAYKKKHLVGSGQMTMIRGKLIDKDESSKFGKKGESGGVTIGHGAFLRKLTREVKPPVVEKEKKGESSGVTKKKKGGNATGLGTKRKLAKMAGKPQKRSRSDGVTGEVKMLAARPHKTTAGGKRKLVVRNAPRPAIPAKKRIYTDAMFDGMEARIKKLIFC